MNYEKLVGKIKKYTEKSVKKSRYEHTIRVADFCIRICKRYGFDEKPAYIAGLGHDMCKEMAKPKMIRLAKKDGQPISDSEKNKPSLLHGRAAAIMMRKKFGIKDEDILHAVAVHVTGKIGMSTLAKVLFVADKCEPGRPQASEEYYEKLFALDFEEMFLSVLQENNDYLTSRGIKMAPEDAAILEYYKGLRK